MANHYYGTITITSGEKSATWKGYVGGSDGYYLEGFILTIMSM